MATKYIFRKTHDVDKEKFVELLLAAKGGRTMKDFATACGVNPSTFTRIAQKANKGASSPELIEAIAEHAMPNSGVTIEALADANGYTIENDTGIKGLRITSYFDNNETLIRNILVQAILDRGHSVRMGNIKYHFSKSLALSPDALIMTEAFGKENEVWFVDSILATPRITRDETHPIHKSRAKQMAFDKIARFVFISMNPVELFRPSRFSLVVIDPEMYEIIVEEFHDTIVCTNVSVILIDMLNSCIKDEFVLPNNTTESVDSYFMTTPIIEDNNDDYYDDSNYGTEDDE